MLIHLRYSSNSNKVNVPVDEAAVVTEVVGGNVDAGKVVDD